MQFRIWSARSDLGVNAPQMRNVPASKYGKIGQTQAVGPVGAPRRGDANPCPEAMDDAMQVPSFT